MYSEINISDLLVFSDELKVLVLGKYLLGTEAYLHVVRVNETETMTIGEYFYLKLVDNLDELECELVSCDELISALDSIVEKTRT